MPLQRTHACLAQATLPRGAAASRAAPAWHAGRFPEGLLRAEREAAEVLVLCELGQVSEASQRAALFEQRDPDSPLWRALHVSCAVKQK